jgi:hypothetical protein
MTPSYDERAAQVGAASTIAVWALLSPDNSYMEFWMLQPRMETPSELPTARQFSDRQLRPVGVLGTAGAAFSEPLPADVVTRLSNAFVAYARSLMGASPAPAPAPAPEAVFDDSIEFCEKLFLLPDLRPES